MRGSSGARRRASRGYQHSASATRCGARPRAATLTLALTLPLPLTLTLTLTPTLTPTLTLLNPNPNANPITLALAQVHLMNQKQRLGMSDAVAIRQLVDESQQKVNQLLGVQQTRRELAKGFTRERLHAYP